MEAVIGSVAPWATGTIEPLLAGYAAGVLPPPVAAVVASHLEANASHRRLLQDLTAAAAISMEDLPPAGIADRDRRLAAVFSAAPVDAPRQTPPPPSPGLPAPLRRYVGRDLAEVPWRPMLPGMRQWIARRDGAWTTRLLRGRPGAAIPHHGHRGIELVLVVHGTLHDGDLRLGPGDLAVSDEDVDHRPCVGDNGECVCALVSSAPIRLRGFAGFLLNPLMRD